MTKATRQTLTALALAPLLLALSACAGGMPDGTSPAKAVDSMMGKRAAVQTRLTTQAAEAIATGRTKEALASYEKLYQQDKRDLDVAINYAQLLRKNGETAKAAEILAPFVKSKAAGSKKQLSPLLLNEYAAIQIEMGDFAAAMPVLQQVIDDPAAAPHHADALNLQGVALDAQGSHKEAEQKFRLALEGWNGNPTSVMNNLALCLASQAMFDESLNTLRRALVMAPDKQEIARNIQIVSELRDAIVPTAPVNIKKN